MLNWRPWIFVWLICLHLVFRSDADPNLSNHKLSGIIKWNYEKRPFCNAFTGCGKKRGPFPPYPVLKRSELEDTPYTGSSAIASGGTNNDNYNSEGVAEGLGDLIDINAEPAVENVQKQIMSQAKIFEAIREASKEIFRQKNKQKLRNQQQQQQRQQQLLQENENN